MAATKSFSLIASFALHLAPSSWLTIFEVRALITGFPFKIIFEGIKFLLNSNTKAQEEKEAEKGKRGRMRTRRRSGEDKIRKKEEKVEERGIASQISVDASEGIDSLG